MNRVRVFSLVFVMAFVAALAAPVACEARDVPPIVSTDWLQTNMNNPKVRIIDIRKVEEYKEGHVPSAINIFYNSWAIKKKDLDNELPENDDLMDIVGSAGVSADSWVVVVGKTDTPTDQVNQTRVAWTLKYAGIENVGVLDGGHNKWVADKRPISTDQVKPKSVEFKPKWNQGVLASKEYVLSKIGKSTIVDTRMPDFFFGVSKLDIVARPGHVKGAVSLPSPWVFAKDGTFKPVADLEAMSAGVIGTDKSKEVITCCDTGRLCSGWWWVFSEVLGYKNVKGYDGSAQEWSKDPNAPMVKYSWQ